MQQHSLSVSYCDLHVVCMAGCDRQGSSPGGSLKQHSCLLLHAESRAAACLQSAGAGRPLCTGGV